MMSSSSGESQQSKIEKLEAKLARAEAKRDQAESEKDKDTANSLTREIGGLAQLLAELKAEARQARPGNISQYFFHTL